MNQEKKAFTSNLYLKISMVSTLVYDLYYQMPFIGDHLSLVNMQNEIMLYTLLHYLFFTII